MDSTTDTTNILDLEQPSRLYNLLNIIPFVIFVIVLIFVLLMRSSKVSFGELWNTSIEKINYKIENMQKDGFKVNVTYLYYMSYNQGKQENIIKDNIAAFLDTIDHLYSYKATNITDIINKNINNNYYLDNKVSLKLNQIGSNYKESLHNMKQILDYAKKHNLFVWIACHKHKDLDDEMETYLTLLNNGYKNVGLTLACYNNSINDRVDKILDANGTVRLVKGYYKDGDIRDDKLITQNYLNNAYKLVEHDGYHQLATHDFKNVIHPLYLKYKNTKHDLETNDYLEFGFFYNALKHIKYHMKSYKINIKHKCCLVTYGNKMKYLKSNIRDVSLWKMFRLKTIL